jgi:hypothetical protein
MAAVVVTNQNTRIDTADVVGTEWTGIGGGAGPGAETDYSYQGGTCISRKGTAGTRGIQFDDGVTTDMTGAGTYQTYMAKFICTTPGLLELQSFPGLVLRVGSSGSDYYQYDVHGSDTYPIKESWLILAIDPNIASHRTSTTGTPVITAVDHWSIVIDLVSVSKAENYALDAIDVGAGLTLVGGDGASDDGVWADYLAHDEGTAANRFGYIHSKEGVLYLTGEFIIGTATATVFTDSNQTLVFSDGLFAAGFSTITLDLQTAATAVSWDNISIGSQGTVAGEDTRPVLTVTGNTGTFSATTCTFNNFSSITLTSGCDLENCIINNSGAVDLGGAAMLEGSSILNSTAAADTSSLIWDLNVDPDGEFDDMAFTQGVNAHHAIEFGTNSPLTMTVRGLVSTGFDASDAANGSFFHVLRTSGTVTINVVGGTGNFSFKSAGATVNVVVDPVTSLFTVLDETNSPLQNARVLVEASDGTGVLPFNLSTTITRTGSVATATATAHGMGVNDVAVVVGAVQDEYNGQKSITAVTANTFDYTVSGTPTTPATGTITTTGAVVSGLTNVDGEISDTRTWSSAQPITGVIRSGTSTPFYKPSGITGIISTTLGISTTNVLIRDD